MTCIVAIEYQNEVWMGGDSIAIDNSEDACQVASPKVFIRDGLIFGCSGGFREQQAIQYAMNVPDRPADGSDEKWICVDLMNAVREALRSTGAMRTQDGADKGENFIVGINGRAYVIESGFGFVRSSRGYEAIGCGAKYALGSLYGYSAPHVGPTDRITQALQAAEFFNAGVRGPFTILAL